MGPQIRKLMLDENFKSIMDEDELAASMLSRMFAVAYWENTK